MGDNEILLGKRHFWYGQEQSIHVEGWTFRLSPGFRLVAGGSSNPVHSIISLFRSTEKVAQLCLTHRRWDTDLTIQAVASDVSLEVSAPTRTVTLAEKV